MVNQIITSFYWNSINSLRRICSYLRLTSVPVPQMTFFRRYFWRRSASCAATALAFVLLRPTEVTATSFTWAAPSTGNANGRTTANWSGGNVPPTSGLTTSDVFFGGNKSLDTKSSWITISRSFRSPSIPAQGRSILRRIAAQSTLTIGTGGITNNSSNTEHNYERT